MGVRTSTTWKKGTNPKGTGGKKHKKTILKEKFGVKNWEQLEKFVENKGLQKLTTEMGTLKGHSYATVFLQLCEFIKPKLQRTTLAGDKDNPLIDLSKATITFK